MIGIDPVCSDSRVTLILDAVGAIIRILYPPAVSAMNLNVPEDIPVFSNMIVFSSGV
jgi:hypothetical protein